MRGAKIESWIRTLRPECEMQWANESVLLVEGFHWPSSFDYKPKFTVTLFNWAKSSEDFDGFVLRSKFGHEGEAPLKMVNDLNAEFNFARNYAKGGTLSVETDVPVTASELTEKHFITVYTLFTMANERMQSALAATA